MRPSNLLLLDEPTNHLDLRAKDVLLESLEEFSGTVVFVSHDRYFIDKLATRVFEIVDGRVNAYPGNYEDYLWRKANYSGEAAVSSADQGSEKPESPEAPPETRPRRLNPIRLRQLEERCEVIEREVERLEAEIAEGEGALAVFKSPEETRRLADLLSERRQELGSLLAEWEDVSQQIEANRQS